MYMAVKDGKVLVGAKGQYAFSNPGTLSRSIAQSYYYGKDKLRKGDYEVIEFTLADILRGKDANR
jgi:hypothetical protein